MTFEISVKYSCENPQLVIDSIKHDEIENDDCSITYKAVEEFVNVEIISKDLKILQKTFNSFSQRFKLATDTLNFCLNNKK